MQFVLFCMGKIDTFLSEYEEIIKLILHLQNILQNLGFIEFSILLFEEWHLILQIYPYTETTAIYKGLLL